MHVQTLSYDRQLKNPGKINQQKESMLETKSSIYLMNLKLLEKNVKELY